MINEIKKILYDHSGTVGLYEGDSITCIEENEFDDVAEYILKLFIPDNAIKFIKDRNVVIDEILNIVSEMRLSKKYRRSTIENKIGWSLKELSNHDRLNRFSCETLNEIFNDLTSIRNSHSNTL